MTQSEHIQAVLKIMATLNDDNLQRALTLAKEGGHKREFNRLIADTKSLNRVAELLVAYDNVTTPESEGGGNGNS
ncbi:MAG TPA: hypothetical protein PLZ51_11950 [Aggregatilineales bacterium]|nr:hypothetical protein [Aggregatilineales bacterium]